MLFELVRKLSFWAFAFRLEIKFKVLLRIVESVTLEVPEAVEEESEKDSMIYRVTELFGVEVTQKFQGKLKRNSQKF